MDKQDFILGIAFTEQLLNSPKENSSVKRLIENHIRWLHKLNTKEISSGDLPYSVHDILEFYSCKKPNAFINTDIDNIKISDYKEYKQMLVDLADEIDHEIKMNDTTYWISKLLIPYLNQYIEKGVIEFRIKKQIDNHVIIHPLDYDGETVDLYI